TSDEAVPWEQPARIGWIRAFSDTVRGAMFGGPGFFAAMRPGGSLAPAYLFFLLLGYISIVSSLLWSRAFEALLPDMSPFSAERVGLPVLLLLAPMSLGLMQLFVTGWVRLIIGLASPSRADFVLVFRVVGYAFAPFVLSVAPFIGPPLGSAWFLALLIMGCRGALGLSPLLAVLAPLPPALLMLGAITWFFL
ncbi:MAG: hypothetical protein LBH65_02585, partial [Desulfovibrio sp.]|nr:hypothetical protein [Desulfovibrio sp.]